MNILYEILGAAAIATASYLVGRVTQSKDSAIDKWKNECEKEKQANEAIKNATDKLLHDDIDELSKKFFKH